MSNGADYRIDISLNNTQDILLLMEKENDRTIQKMRQGEKDLPEPSAECKSKDLFMAQKTASIAQREGTERLIGNQEVIFQRILRNRNTEQRKRLKIGPLDVTGFEARDILRMIIVLFIIYVFLAMQGWLPSSLMLR